MVKAKCFAKPKGLIIVPDFISEAQEVALTTELLGPKAPWLDKSHLKFSNTKQQEYGPVVSDAMEVITDRPATRAPPECCKLIAQIASEATRLGLESSSALAAPKTSFLRVNHYNQIGGGYMHKHMDSKKCFGPVIACCSLLADAAMSFYDTQGNSFGMAKVHDTVEVCIPRRSLYFMTGPSRHQWQHGIRKDQCALERLSLTLRSVRADAPTTFSGNRQGTGKQIVAKRPAVVKQPGVVKRPASVKQTKLTF